MNQNKDKLEKVAQDKITDMTKKFGGNPFQNNEQYKRLVDIAKQANKYVDIDKYLGDFYDPNKLMKDVFGDNALTRGILGESARSNKTPFIPENEPQKAYNWELEFRDPTSGSQEGAMLKYFAKTTSIPPRVVDVIKRYHAGVEYAYTGRDTSPRIFRATFWDNKDLRAYRFFNKWMELTQYGNEKNRALPSTYHRDIVVRLQDTTNTTDTSVFMFEHCFPQEITEASLNYGESGEYTFDVMFHFTKRGMV